ncbi:MAG: flagellar assembly protein FliW [Acidobacteriota bacterium]
MTKRLSTVHFGEIEFIDSDIIRFPKGLPGFERLKRFLLIDGKGLGPFKFLQSLDEPAISFPLLAPNLVWTEYRFKLTRQQRRELVLGEEERELVYCIVTLSGQPQSTTVNLFAPLVINSSRMLGLQVILLESGYPVAQPILLDAQAAETARA